MSVHILLLHGAGGALFSFWLLRLILYWFGVRAVVLPWPQSTVGIEDGARSVNLALLNMGFRPADDHFIIVGQSAGGLVAFQLWFMFKWRVTRLISVGSPWRGSRLLAFGRQWIPKWFFSRFHRPLYDDVQSAGHQQLYRNGHSGLLIQNISFDLLPGLGFDGLIGVDESACPCGDNEWCEQHVMSWGHHQLSWFDPFFCHNLAKHISACSMETKMQ